MLPRAASCFEHNNFSEIRNNGEDFSLFTDPFSYEVDKDTNNIQMEAVETHCESVHREADKELGIRRFLFPYVPSRFKELRCNSGSNILVGAVVFSCEI